MQEVCLKQPLYKYCNVFLALFPARDALSAVQILNACRMARVDLKGPIGKTHIALEEFIVAK